MEFAGNPFVEQVVEIFLELVLLVVIPALGYQVHQYIQQSIEKSNAQIGEYNTRRILLAVRHAVLATEQLAKTTIVQDKLTYAMKLTQNMLDEMGIESVNAMTLRTMIESAVKENFGFDDLFVEIEEGEPADPVEPSEEEN